MRAAVTVFFLLSLFGLNFSVYRIHYIVEEKMTWDDAQKYCIQHYDDLSTMSKEESEMLSISTDSRYNWVGLHRFFKNPEKWIWSGGEEEPISWDIDQPNSDAENCGGIDQYTSKMHDISCINTLYFFCMNVYDIVVVHQNKTWHEALDYCRQEYIDLASLSSEIIMKVGETDIITSQTAYVWTGLRFMAGHWFWVSGDDLQYKAWSAEEEIQCPSGNLRCGALDREENIWKPADCEERYNFLCLTKP